MKLRKKDVMLVVFVLLLQVYNPTVFAHDNEYINLNFDDGKIITGNGDSWIGSPPTIVDVSGNSKAVKMNDSLSGMSYYQYKVSGLFNKISGRYVVETKIKRSTASDFYLKLFLNDGNVGAVDLTSRFIDEYLGFTWVDNTATNNIIGHSNTDVVPTRPDFSQGWDTLYICVDSENGSYTIYKNSLENIYTKTEAFLGNSQNYLNSMRFGLSQRNEIDPKSTAYVDYIKIYPYSMMSIPTLDEQGIDIYEDFEDCNGENIRQGIFAKVSDEISAISLPDPSDQKNICAKVSADISDTGAKYASIPIGRKKATIEYRFKMDTYPKGAAETVALMMDNRSKIYLETINGTSVRYTDPNKQHTFNLNSGWNTIKWLVDTTKKQNSIACYINGEFVASANATDTILSSVRLAFYSGSDCYIDNIRVHSPAPGDVTGDVENINEEFYRSNGESLTQHGFMLNGFDLANTTVIQGDIAKFSLEEIGVASGYYNLDITNTQNPYIIETRLCHGSSQVQTLSLSGDTGSIAKLSFSNGRVWDALNDKVIGVYSESSDDVCGNDDVWHTYFMIVDPEQKNVEIQIDDPSVRYLYSLPEIGTDNLQLSLSLKNEKTGKNTLYMDYLKVYREERFLPGPLLSNQNYEVNFTNEENGQLHLNGSYELISGFVYKKRVRIEFAAKGLYGGENLVFSLENLAGDTIYNKSIQLTNNLTIYTVIADLDDNTVKISKGNDIIKEDLLISSDDMVALKFTSTATILEGVRIHRIGGYTDSEKQAQLAAGYWLYKQVRNSTSDYLKIPKGGYRVDNSYNGSEGKLYISNKDNFNLDGNDSEIIISEFTLHGIYLNNCTNVTISNLKLDYDPLPFSQGTIVALYPSERSFDLKIDDGYEIPTIAWGGMRTVYYKADGSEQIPITANDSASVQRVIDSRTIRLRLSSGDIFTRDDISVGDKFVCRKFDLDSKSTISFSFSKECKLENVSVYTSPKLAITESGGYGAHSYTNVYINRRPDTDRLVSSIADGFHFANVQNGCTLDNCEVGHTLDDCLNSYGQFMNVYKKISDSEYMIAVRNPENPIRVGETVEFYNPSWDRIDSAIIESYSPVEVSTEVEGLANLLEDLSQSTGINVVNAFTYRSLYIVQFDKDCPDVQYLDYALSSFASGGKGLTITNCYFHDSHVRGVLVKASEAVIKNNKFENIAKSAIAVIPERSFGEGGFPNNLEISGNTIDKAGYSRKTKDVRNYASIFVSGSDNAYVPTISDNTNIKNIQIKNNIINNSGYIPMYIANVEDCEISENVINGAFGDCKQENDGVETGFGQPWYGIKIDKSSNVKVIDNSFWNMPDFILKNIYNPDYFEYYSEVGDEGGWNVENATLVWEVSDAIKPAFKYLTATPLGDYGRIEKNFRCSAVAPMIASFTASQKMGTVFALVDENENEVFGLRFGMDGMVYISDYAAFPFLDGEYADISVYFSEDGVYEVWFGRQLKETGAFNGKFNKAVFSFSQKIHLRNVAISMLDDKVYAIQSDDTNNTVDIYNNFGQTLSNIHVFGAKYEDSSQLLSSTCFIHDLKPKTSIDFNEKVDKIFVWKDNLAPVNKAIEPIRK